ncbi:hypothetical protein BC477_00490 [Clavibacter michiganensis subsp. michiganensis]|uniref:Uncharacterized protein n=1 Tax=Clavibacter michiganensis subsp. michiganensis TaxID=33013 RepID=A0A251XF66_CLAMM|nr:hypothetical protein BC477_00490 [Clavibacter michiganensis subsp. michiganensis]OUE00947.1 hypothetical protein CMMCAS07_16025 [Clavibacter michiganensis subsp. michiganensis]
MSTAGSDGEPAPPSGSTPAALEGAVAGDPEEAEAPDAPGARATAAGAALQVGTIVSVSLGSSLAGLVIPRSAPSSSSPRDRS